MPDETEWERVVLPVLRELLAEERGDPEARPDDRLRELTGGDVRLIAAVARRIRDDGLAGVYLGAEGPEFLGGLTPKGMRAVGEWPPGEFAAAVIAGLEEAISSAPEGQRSKLRAALESVQRVGEGTAAEIMAATIRLSTGM